MFEGENKMATKKLYRNPNGQMLAGVCSGLAEYLDIDLVIVRLIFVLLFFFGGHGLLIYVILWILISTITQVKFSFLICTIFCNIIFC